MALSMDQQKLQRYFRDKQFDADKGACPGNWRTVEEATGVVKEADMDKYAVLWGVMVQIEYSLTLTPGFVNFLSTRGMGMERTWKDTLEIYNRLYDFGTGKSNITKWTSLQCRWEKGRNEMKRLCGGL